MPYDWMLLAGFIVTVCIVGYAIYKTDIKKNDPKYWRK